MLPWRVGLPAPKPPPLPAGWTRVPEAPPANWPGLTVPELVIDPVTAVQRELLNQPDIAARYPALAATGIMDGTTKAALAEFQYRAGLPVTGQIDRTTEATLGIINGIPGLPRLPIPAPRAPGPVATAAKRELKGATKTIVAALGMLLTVLAMVSGLGFIPPDAREIIAVMIAAVTPVVVFFVPEYKPPKPKTGAKT